jgi:plastocyanin
MTRTRLALVLVLLAAVALVAGCGKGDRNASPEATGSVVMKDSEFRPNHVSVPTGTTVSWRNDDGFEHNVVFAEGPASDTLLGGGSYQRTFDEAGTFDYECTIHPGMVGRVTVTES